MGTIERNRGGTTVMKAGEAVGVPEKKWFIAIVSNNTEKKCSERLMQMGYESYVPTQQEIRYWNTGKKNVIERIIFPTLIFVHVDEKERKEIVTLSFINRFMTDRANPKNPFNHHPLAVIPDDQIVRLKFILYNADSSVEFMQCRFNVGNRVRVIRGKLIGIEGTVLENVNGETFILVGFDILGYAKTRISTIDLEKLDYPTSWICTHGSHTTRALST